MNKKDIFNHYMNWCYESVENSLELIDNPILDQLFCLNKQLRYDLFRSIYGGGCDFPSLMLLSGFLHYCNDDDGEVCIVVCYENGRLFDYFVSQGDSCSESSAKEISTYNAVFRYSDSSFKHKSKHIPISKLIGLMDELNRLQLICDLASKNNDNKEYYKTTNIMKSIVEDFVNEK